MSDVMQLHRLDREATPEEILRALHEVVLSGKARTAWTEFVSMQPFYSLSYREEEREMLPFCPASGVGVIPWSLLGRGVLDKPRTKDDDDDGDDDDDEDDSDREKSVREQTDAKTRAWFASANWEIVDAVKKVAVDKGVPMAHVATAWVLHQGCWPILGLNSEKRVAESVTAVDLQLTPEKFKFLEQGYQHSGAINQKREETW